MVRQKSHEAITLVEVLVAVAILAGLGMSVFDLLSAGFSGSARAEKNQTAPRVLARVIDNLVARGYAGMFPAAGSSQEFSWSESTDLVMPGSPVVAPASAGGITGSFRVDAAGPGLLRLAVTVRWTDPRAAGTLTAFRYLADPALGMSGVNP